MLVSNSFTGNLRDTLGFESSYSYFNPIVLRKYAASLLSKDSLHWVGDSTVYPRRIFRFYPQLCSSYFWQDSLSVEVLAEKSISSDEFRYDFGVISGGSCTGTDVSFPLFYFATTASLGFVSDNDCHSALYDIYCAKKTTCDTCDS